MFYLSQSHLQRYVKCPVEFQRVYLEQLLSLTEPTHLAKQEWGTQFHLIMQQLQLGLALEQIVADEKLKQSVQSLITKLPDFLERRSPVESQAEYRRTLKINDFLLTIICDWVVFREETLEIYDWKTYPQPQKVDYLRHNWQTKLYLYVLAEITDYAPEKLSMTYWFVTAGEEPQSLKFTYSQAWHQQIKAELTTLLDRLQTDLNNYFTHNIPLHHPQQQPCSVCAKWQDQGRSPEIAEFLGGKSLTEFLGEIEEVQL